MLRISIIISFFLFSSQLSAQSSRDVQAPKPPAPQYQSSKKQSKTKGFFKGMFERKEKTEVEKFRDRVSDAYKENAKEAKKGDKKRYRDPTYFGHRKPPKKRPPGKQKFCKQCGMKH